MLAKYRVNLAPLRFGAGVKGKIADGWRAGTPCCTTEVGAEGMAITVHTSPTGRQQYAQWGGTVAYTLGELAERAVELHSNQAVWSTAQV